MSFTNIFGIQKDLKDTFNQTKHTDISMNISKQFTRNTSTDIKTEKNAHEACQGFSPRKVRENASGKR